MTQATRITGILKQNESHNPKAPQLKGWTTINGQQYWLSAWWHPNGSGKAGSKLEHVAHYSLIFEPAEEQRQEHVGGTPFHMSSGASAPRGHGDAPSGYPAKAYMGVPANMGAHPSTQPQLLANTDDEIPF